MRETDFLRAIREAPDDDVLRLAYSDWLEQRRRPVHAAYLRLIVEAAARLDAGEDLAEIAHQIRDLSNPYRTKGDRPRLDWRCAVGIACDVTLVSVAWGRRRAAVEALTEAVHISVPAARALIAVSPARVAADLRIEEAGVLAAALVGDPSQDRRRFVLPTLTRVIGRATIRRARGRPVAEPPPVGPPPSGEPSPPPPLSIT